MRNGNGVIVWSRDASQLQAGVFIDTITVTAPGAGVSALTVVDTLIVVQPFALSDAADELCFGGVLSPLQIAFLDALGNDDGTYNVGDVLAWDGLVPATGFGRMCERCSARSGRCGTSEKEHASTYNPCE